MEKTHKFGRNGSKEKGKKKKRSYLAVSSTVFFDGPTSFWAEGFQHLVVVAVLGQVEVPLSSETRVYLSSDGSSPPLPPPVVLPLPPRGLPPRRRRWRGPVWRHFPATLSHPHGLTFDAPLMRRSWFKLKSAEKNITRRERERERERELCSQGMRSLFFAVMCRRISLFTLSHFLFLSLS